MLAAGLVKVDDAVEVAVIGDAYCGLTIRFGGKHHLLNACGSVEHRVLGVVMQVDEALSH